MTLAVEHKLWLFCTPPSCSLRSSRRTSKTKKQVAWGGTKARRSAEERSTHSKLPLPITFSSDKRYISFPAELPTSMSRTTPKTAATFVTMLILMGEQYQQHVLAFSSQSSARRQQQTLVNGDTISTEVDSFAEFCLMRLGVDPSSSRNDNSRIPGESSAVYWVGTGELYEAYSGRLLAKFEGFDVGKGVILDDDDSTDCSHVRQFSRKIFWWRHPESNEIMTEYNGKPIQPIRYDYQVFDYRRAPSTEEEDYPSSDFSCIGTELSPILPSIVSGPREVPVLPITAETSGRNRLAFQCPVFIDVETPMGPYQAWENYHYTHDISYPERQPPICVWARQGGAAPFVENGKGVMRSRAYRVEDYDDLPQSVKELVETEDYGMFRHPPRDMAEVERLREEERKRRTR